jgi:hypothetical protein
MAENDPTIELPAEGGTDTNENRDKPDLRRSLRKQQVMTPLGVDVTNSRPGTRTFSKKKHDAGKDPEKLIPGESGHDNDRSPVQPDSGHNVPEKLDLSGSGHNEGKNPMQLNSGKIVLSIPDINL